MATTIGRGHAMDIPWAGVSWYSLTILAALLSGAQPASAQWTDTCIKQFDVSTEPVCSTCCTKNPWPDQIVGVVDASSGTNSPFLQTYDCGSVIAEKGKKGRPGVSHRRLQSIEPYTCRSDCF